MNAINKFFLALVLLPSRFFPRWGIDASQLKAILTIKLTIDDRRPNTLQATRQNHYGEKEISNATLGTMMLSAVMGTMLLFVFMLGNDYVSQFTLYFSMFIVFLCMTLVSDFTSVLIDVRDTQIILPKPVNDRTFVTARLLHIFIHICKLVLPMSLPCVIYFLVKSNISAPIIFLLLVFLTTIFSIFLINALYISILRYTTPEKFKNIISYVQIGFAIAIFGAYQLLPRLMDDIQMEGFAIREHTWLILLPPYWFACAFNTFVIWQADGLQLAATFLAFVAPLLSLYLVLKYLAPAFNQKLAMISGSEGAASGAVLLSPKLHTTGFTEKLARLMTSTKVEEAGFLFTWKMMARSREFKIKVYPSIGYFLVMLVLAFIQKPSAKRSELFMGPSFLPLVIIYLSSLILIVAITHMVYAEKYKASWLFFITPIKRPGEVISGALKATMVQFFSLIAITVLIAGVCFWGWAILPNLLLALSNQLVINYAIANIGYKQLPFTQPFSETQKGGKFIYTIYLFMLTGLIGTVHYLLYQNTVAIGVFLALSLISLAILQYFIRKTSWENLRYAA